MDMSYKQIADKAVQITEDGKPLILLQPIMAGPNSRMLIFNSERVTLGRVDDCDIVLSDPCVSPIHVVFSRNGEGWTITDENSVNGTWLNNQKLEPHTPHVLTNTDVITIQMQRLDEELSYVITDERPQHKEAPDGTMMLSEPSIWWNYKFIFFASLCEKKQPETGRSFLKYDQDGNLYSDIPSPEYMCEHKYKQCEHCGAFAEQEKKICPNCRHSLPEKRPPFFVDPVVFTDNYHSIAEELGSIISRMFPEYALGLCFGFWGAERTILREQYHIIWRSPAEMNPDVIFD